MSHGGAAVASSGTAPAAPRRRRASLGRRALFFNFHSVYRAGRWLRMRFTSLGTFALGTFGVSVAFGLNTWATLSYQVASLVLGMLLVAVGSAVAFRPRLALSRRLPACATVDEPFRYTVIADNRGMRPERGLTLLEALDHTRPTVDEFFRAASPLDARRNWFDRRVGYPRWALAMRLRRGAEVEPQPVPALDPGDRIPVTCSMTPTRRGYVRLDALYLLRPDPLGLFNARRVHRQSQSVLVLPKRYPVTWSDASAGPPDASGDVSEGVALGATAELAYLREYKPGDALRKFHWKGWARHGVPIVKEFHDETRAREALVLDVAMPDDGTRERFEAAVSVAASIAEAGAADGRGGVDRLVVGGDVLDLPASGGDTNVDRVLETLACVHAGGPGALEETRAALADAAPPTLACVCVLLDWDAPRRDLVRGLVRAGTRVLALVVGAAPEAPDAGPLSETPERLRWIDPAQVARSLEALP